MLSINFKTLTQFYRNFSRLGYDYTVRFITPILLHRMPCYYCANLKAIRYESTSLNRIIADKSHRVIVAKEMLLPFPATLLEN